MLYQRVARLAVATAHGEDLVSSSGPRGKPGVTPASTSGSRGSPAQVRTPSGRCTPGPRLLPAPSSPPAAQEAGATDAPRGRARASLSSLLPTLTPRAPPDCHLDPRRLHAPHSCLSTPPFPRAPPGSGLAAGDFSRVCGARREGREGALVWPPASPTPGVTPLQEPEPRAGAHVRSAAWPRGPQLCSRETPSAWGLCICATESPAQKIICGPEWTSEGGGQNAGRLPWHGWWELGPGVRPRQPTRDSPRASITLRVSHAPGLG